MVNISILTPREITAHDALIDLMRKMGKLSEPSRIQIYRRWIMLHMITEEELTVFKSWLSRVNDDSGADRREK